MYPLSGVLEVWGHTPALLTSADARPVICRLVFSVTGTQSRVGREAERAAVEVPVVDVGLALLVEDALHPRLGRLLGPALAAVPAGEARDR